MSIQPGATAFTRMPRSAKAIACERVSATTAPLLAAYEGLLREPNQLNIDAKFTTAP
ncbi:hypothetical protein D3C86_1565360 [compost metagenome]